MRHWRKITFIIFLFLVGCSANIYEYEPEEESAEWELNLTLENLSIQGNHYVLPGMFFTDNVVTAVSGAGAYPRLYELADGTVLLGFDRGRSNNTTAVMVTSSTDMVHWTDPVIVAAYDDLYAANLTFIQLENGDILGFHRANDDLANEPRRDGYYSSIRASISRDNGQTWEFHSIVVEEVGRGGVYEPHPILIDGQVAVFYANDSFNVVNRHEEQNVEFRLWDGENWSETFIASNGIDTRSRDGMAVLDRTIDGGYVMVIEATNVARHPFVVQMTTSPNGLDWPNPMHNIFIPRQPGRRAAAPYVVTLLDGRFAVSFQTDAGRPVTGDSRAHMKVMFSLDTQGYEWTEPFIPFLVPDNGMAVWTSLFLWRNSLFAAAGTNHPHGGGILLREASVVPYTATGQNVINNGMFMFGHAENWYFTMNDHDFHHEFPRMSEGNRHGNRYITLTNNTGSDISINQQIPGVAAGEYTFSIRAFGGTDVAVSITQGSERVAFTFNTPPGTDFYTITVPNITLVDGIAHLSIAMLGSTGETLSLDDVELIKN